MPDAAVAVAAIVMSGVFLTVVAWQLLAIARTALARDKDVRNDPLQKRLAAQELHDDRHAEH